MSIPVSDFRLEKLLLGELSAEESRTLLSDPEIAARVAAMREQNEAILRRHPLRSTDLPVAKRIQHPHRSFAAWKLRIPALGASLAVMTAALILVVPRWIDRGDDYRIKGESSRLYLYKKTAEEATELSDGAVAHSGDSIQIAFSSAQNLYGYIFSIDGNGRLTPHYPEIGASAATLTKGKYTLLDYSYILDDAPKFELFLFVTSKTPFDIKKIESVISGLSPENDMVHSMKTLLGKNFTLSSIKLAKE